MRFRTSGRNWEGRLWYLAPSLVVLARQISDLHPAGKPGDGTVASKNHDRVSPSSDHRPRPFTGRGIVRAIDAGESEDADPMVDALVASEDPRIAYIIYEGRSVWSVPRNGFDAWEAQPYRGINPHSHHFHLSTLRTATADNDTRPWTIPPIEEPDMSLPIDANSHKEEIRHVQEMLGVTASGTWDFRGAVQTLAVRSGTGDNDGKDGTHINGRMYTHLLGEFIQRAAPAPEPTAGVSEGRVIEIVNASRIRAD